MPAPWSVSGSCIRLVQYWNSSFFPAFVSISFAVHLRREEIQLVVSFLFPFDSCIVTQMQKPVNKWPLLERDRGADGTPVPTYMTITSFRIVFVFLVSDYDREQFADNQIPLLVIGTKLDQIPETKRNEVLTRTAFLAEDFNAEEINLVSILVASVVFLLYGIESDF